jgi:hypothetical protein
MEPTADARFVALALMTVLLATACSRPLAEGSDADAQDVPDPSTSDLPPETTEYEGILLSANYGGWPTQFVACDTGEVWEISNRFSDPDWRWKGSCSGVFVRVRGELDRSVDPPVLIWEEYLERHWCEPGECVGYCNPQYDSCYAENMVWPCDPLSVIIEDCHAPEGRCNPIHFPATEQGGWMETRCVPALGQAKVGEPCEYPTEPYEVDTCLHSLRCWNPEGDVMKPGICVEYCDPAGEEGPACDGTCVQCSGDDRGLCLHGCSGDDCNIDAFC